MTINGRGGPENGPSAGGPSAGLRGPENAGLGEAAYTTHKNPCPAFMFL